MYILENYGKSIEIYRNKKQSQPTFRTNCSLKTLRKGLSTTKCISKPESPGYRVLKVNYIDDDYTSTNFDLVHSNIGERPREINNSLLED